MMLNFKTDLQLQNVRYSRQDNGTVDAAITGQYLGDDFTLDLDSQLLNEHLLDLCDNDEMSVAMAFHAAGLFIKNFFPEFNEPHHFNFVDLECQPELWIGDTEYHDDSPHCETYTHKNPKDLFTAMFRGSLNAFAKYYNGEDGEKLLTPSGIAAATCRP